MPILDVDRARSIIVLKRFMRSGYAGVENPLFTDAKTALLFGDAKTSITDITEALTWRPKDNRSEPVVLRMRRVGQGGRHGRRRNLTS